VVNEQLNQLLKSALCWAKPQMAAIADELDPDTALADLGLESVALLEMAAYVEDELQAEFSDEKLMGIRTIADFLVVIREACAAEAAPSPESAL
jgi:acyl carrier protein